MRISGAVLARPAPTTARPAAQVAPPVARRIATVEAARPATSSPAWSFGNLAVRAGITLGGGDVPRAREADRMAGRANAAPLRIAEAATPTVQRACAAGQDEARLQRACASCEDEAAASSSAISSSNVQRACAASEDVATVQRRGGWNVQPARRALAAEQGGGQGGGHGSRPRAPPSVERALAGPGQPLGGEIRNSMEHRFGFDFGAIRIHTDSGSAGSAQDVRARAYTVGGDIVFGAGEYRPGSKGSEALLAHELVHTIQQGASRPLGAAKTLAAGSALGFSVSRMSQSQGAGTPDAGGSAAPACADHAAAPTMRGRLTVGAANDRYEQEAEHVAAQVIRMPDPAAGPSTPGRAASGDARPVGLSLAAGSAAGRLQRLASSPLFDDSATEGGATETSASGPAAAAPTAGAAGTPAAATQPAKPDETAAGTAQTLQRAPMGGMDDGMGSGQPASSAAGSAPGGAPGGTPDRRTTTQLLDCIHALGEDHADECRHQVLGSPRPTPPLCDPATGPAAAAFTGTPPAKTRFAGKTDWHFAGAPPDWGFSIIRVFFDGATSWMKPAVTSTNRPQIIAGCQTAVAGGKSFRFNPSPQRCASSLQPDPSIRATTAAECETKIGAEFDRVAAIELARVLTHEQYHFRIACVMAGKGSAALKVSSPSPAEDIRHTVETKARALSNQYDTETDHGCIAAKQAAWQADVDAGLPTTKVP